MARSRRSGVTGEEKEGEGAPPASQRLDLWLWFARFLRTRASCAELVRKGHVRINGRRVNTPGTQVRAGDVLTLALPGRTLIVAIQAFAERRGDAKAASALFAFITPDDARRE
jgi:ribosome-associated heat shock protein Hsp15